MTELAPQTLRLKSLLGAIACGVLLSLATGLVENPPEASIIGFTYHGYPLVWRITKTLQPTEFRFTSLAIDTAFWITISFFVFILLEKIALPKLRVDLKPKTFLLPLVLFIPLGLAMDFVHEFGHAFWGTALGGKLNYMKIAYLQLYPRLAITPQFILGKVVVTGLNTEFAYGLFLLGGSLTTNIASWLLALIMLKISLRHRTRVALKILGLFGLLDLPFYVVLPQISLQHWIFLGGDKPEPLLGAQKMGIPDTVFYTILVITTLALAFLYFKPLFEKACKSTRKLFATRFCSDSLTPRTRTQTPPPNSTQFATTRHTKDPPQSPSPQVSPSNQTENPRTAP